MNKRKPTYTRKPNKSNGLGKPVESAPVESIPKPLPFDNLLSDKAVNKNKTSIELVESVAKITASIAAIVKIIFDFFHK